MARKAAAILRELKTIEALIGKPNYPQDAIQRAHKELLQELKDAYGDQLPLPETAPERPKKA